MVCTLCKRKFGSVAVLTKHCVQSKMHLQNLQVDLLQRAAEREVSAEDMHELDEEAFAERLRRWQRPHEAYVDRAKQRRIKFNQPSRPSDVDVRFGGNMRPGASDKGNGGAGGSGGGGGARFEQPTKDGIGADNVGNKLLKKMGWSEGTGLGRGSQGIVEPIQAEVRARGAGIGSGPGYTISPDDTFKDVSRVLRWRASGLWARVMHEFGCRLPVLDPCTPTDQRCLIRAPTPSRC